MQRTRLNQSSFLLVVSKAKWLFLPFSSRDKTPAAGFHVAPKFNPLMKSTAWPCCPRRALALPAGVGLLWSLATTPASNLHFLLKGIHKNDNKKNCELKIALVSFSFPCTHLLEADVQMETKRPQEDSYKSFSPKKARYPIKNKSNLRIFGCMWCVQMLNLVCRANPFMFVDLKMRQSVSMWVIGLIFPFTRL